MSSKALRLLARRRRQAAQALVLKQAELIAGVPKARDWIKKLLRQNDYSGRPSTLSPVSSPAEPHAHSHTQVPTGALKLVDKTRHVIDTELSEVVCIMYVFGVFCLLLHCIDCHARCPLTRHHRDASQGHS